MSTLNQSQRILLRYLNGSEVNDLVPNYFTYSHNLDVPACVRMFLDIGLLSYASIDYVLSKATVSELKDTAKHYRLKTSGKKQNIIDALLSAVDKDILISRFPKQYYVLTEKGNIELSFLSNEVYNERYTDVHHFIGENSQRHQNMLKLVKSRDFNALYQLLESAGKSPAVNHTDFQSYHVFLDTNYPAINQLSNIGEELKPHVLLCYIQGLRAETSKTVIDDALNIDISFPIIHKLLKVIRATDDLLSMQEIARKTQGITNHTYIIRSCDDEGCCDYCNQQEGMRYNVLDAVIGKNYPPFDDCTCEYCRCFVEFDFDS